MIYCIQQVISFGQSLQKVVVKTTPILIIVLSTWLTARSDGQTVNYSLVTVGNAGNSNDFTGFGGIPYSYRIGTYDVTIGQYVAFLNATARSDPYGLFSSAMSNNLAIAGVARGGSAGNYTYSAMSNGGSSVNRPITYVSWFDAARFANWMSNGQPAGAPGPTTTENGAYALNGATSGAALERNVFNPNTSSPPTFYLPLEDEHYKAAYYSPVLRSGSGGYWKYATQSNVTPGNTIGATANQANWCVNSVGFSVTKSGNYSFTQNYLTDVGAFTGSYSYYGTYDQGGLVYQWNDLDGVPMAARGLRGGNWYYNSAFDMEGGYRIMNAPTAEYATIGFRLASPAPYQTVLHIATGSRMLRQLTSKQLTGGFPVIKHGLGTLIVDGANGMTGPFTVAEGTVELATALALPYSAVQVAGGAKLSVKDGVVADVMSLDVAATGLLDLCGGSLTISRGMSTASVASLLRRGRGDGSWNGQSGVTSSTANTQCLLGSARTVGWRAYGDGAVTLAYAAPGDTNLDWQVDILDAANFLASGKFDAGLAATWSEGDFTYDGLVDILDAADFLSAGLFDNGPYNTPSGAISAVPEPSVLGVFGAGVGVSALIAARRRLTPRNTVAPIPASGCSRTP
jgi:autotransporter-associated beta strand protein